MSSKRRTDSRQVACPRRCHPGTALPAPRPGPPLRAAGLGGGEAAQEADHPHHRRPLTPAEAGLLAALVEAAHAGFDAVAATAPATLRKGPRGGGRDRDAIVAHVIEAEAAYARSLGIRPGRVVPSDREAVAGLRRAVEEALRLARAGVPLVERGWLPRYAAGRIAWHALDHAWEIEDRSG